MLASKKVSRELFKTLLLLLSMFQEISTDDLLRAIKKLKILGNGFTVIPLDSGRYLIQSVPGEFSMDQTAVLQKAESNAGFVTLTILKEELGNFFASHLLLCFLLLKVFFYFVSVSFSPRLGERPFAEGFGPTDQGRPGLDRFPG